ncbi:thiaminase II [Sansalvadorimonas verongulae]|uniref:thiaminase II n=1 Tax=Sansalvadorimonas verongulae TaxID=2172824 RepID=UPI0012BD3C49|nr:thiaminase II [Sansalvadorimonas verongulae]MTI14606.1 thiaminase II [Sansalvadorimonas verongulae]
MNVSDLIASCEADWTEYTQHRFVKELGNSTLPEAAFKHYLQQDYLFLIHFARAYALAVYKSENFLAMQKPLEALHGLINHESRLHVEFCAEWGLTEQDMQNIPEATGTVAYTRLVLDAGQSGSLTDLYAALAPCSIGYGVIGKWLINHPDTVLEGNPYRDWIECYSGAEYLDSVEDSVDQLNELLADIPEDSHMAARVRKIFRDATRMEIAFWEQGYEG